MTEVYLYNKKNTKNADYNILMAYPGPKSFALSSLGYMWLTKLLDEGAVDDVSIEMMFTDTDKTQIINNKVDSICFSFSFDMDFMGIFSILDKYNIPLKSQDRINEPIIFAGGPVVTANPESYKDFFDFFVIGDGEEVNIQIVEILKQSKKDNKTKNETLKILSGIDGVYVPYIEKQVKKISFNLSQCIYTPILSEESYFSNTFIIEISRGCYNRCAFCLASYLNLPIRFVDYETIINNIDLGLKYTNKIALLGAMISAHPRFNDICNYIYQKIQQGQDIQMSVSSLRADALSDDVVKTLVAAGQKNITIAIEAASERLRNVINKNLTEKQITDVITIAKDNGLKGIKIYCMLGLPTETDDDIQEFIRLAKKIKENNKGFSVTFSFSTFIPKAHTPFQWCGRENIKSLEKKQNYLKKELHKLGISSKFSSAKWDYYQAVLSRGDESLTDFLIEVYKTGGKIGSYKSAAKKYNIDTDYFAEKNYDVNQKLPWDFIDVNPNKEFLIDEYTKLLNIN